MSIISACPNCKFGGNIIGGLCENCRDVVKKCNNCNNYIPLHMECYICNNKTNKTYEKIENKNLRNEILLIKNEIKEISQKYDNLWINYNILEKWKLNVTNKNDIKDNIIPTIFNENKEIGYLYIIKEREFYRLNENIYKIGSTNDMKKRFSQYPKGSFLLFFITNIKFREIEKLWIKQLNNISNLKRRKDIGYEYFEGNHMIIINELIKLLI